MNFPSTRQILEANGYRFERRCRCRGCPKSIEFWQTPAGKWLPFELVFESDRNLLTPHWTLCPKADQFRRKQSEKPEAPKMTKAQEKRAKAAKQESLF